MRRFFFALILSSLLAVPSARGQVPDTVVSPTGGLLYEEPSLTSTSIGVMQEWNAARTTGHVQDGFYEVHFDAERWGIYKSNSETAWVQEADVISLSRHDSLKAIGELPPQPEKLYTLEESGSYTSRRFHVGADQWQVKWNGSPNFEVRVYTEEGDLVSTGGGKRSGSTNVPIGDGEFYLQVDGDGGWHVEMWTLPGN